MINRQPLLRQFLYSTVLILLVAGSCFAVAGYIHYRVVAFVLMVVVSLIAVVFDILPVLFAALLTSLIWNFFFIPPLFTLHVGSTEDRIFLLMYLVIATVSAVLTHKIRTTEKKAREQEFKANSVRLYNTLLNSLSHELRTPIAAIVAATDNLQHNNSRLTPLHRVELLQEVNKATLRLNQQVENLLNMSRLESGYLQPRNDWTDMQELLYGIVQRAEENNAAQNISVSVNPDMPLVSLDKGMLEQILQNLLSNAINYTQADSIIQISCICYADVLSIIVEDNGPGFPEAELPHVFEKFYRLKHSVPGGTGLGLSIVKGYAEAMNGKVALSNRREGGALFELSIPVKTSYIKNLKHA